MSELIIAREPLSGILESGLAPQLRAHWEEVAHDKDSIALDPDWDGYLEDERQHRFISWSARRGDKLVGYNGFYVTRHRHYKAAFFALNDVIYVTPEERGVCGISLILHAERDMKAMGVVKAFYHVKVDAMLGKPGDSLSQVEDLIALEEKMGCEFSDALYSNDRTLGGVLEALGYRHVENQFGKLLTGAA